MSMPLRIFSTLVGLLMILPVVCHAARADVEANYLYRLSNFGGPVPCTWAHIAVDAARNEIYLIDEKEVLVFDENGMEIYRFGDDGSLGVISDVAVDDTGNILVLSRVGATQSILRCDFRGQPVGQLNLTGLPPEYSGFSPKRMVFHNSLLYLADTSDLKLVVADGNGRFRSGFDVATLLEIEDDKRIANQISGFSVDTDGNILFTIPVLFSIHRLLPDGTIQSLVRPGSSPGKFNLVGGIVADDGGNIYVADRLKSAVLIFDREFNFIRQFGYRGSRPGNLIGPRDLALDARGRLYVSQLQNRGVSVFKLTQSRP